MAKINNKAKSKRTKKASRSMALGVAEPRLRGPRERGSSNKTQDWRDSPSARTQRPNQIFETMLDWSPWVIMLRQQALLAQFFSRALEAQLTLVGRSSARQPARADKP